MSRVVPRAILPAGAWDDFVANHDRGWFFHTSSWLDYSLAYNPKAIDRSLAILRPSGDVAAVVPLVQEAHWFVMGGHPGADPLVADGVAPELAWGAVEVAARSYGITHAAFRSHPLKEPLHPVPTGYKAVAWPTYVLDLTQPLNQIHRNMRKGNRNIARYVADEGRLVVSREPWAVNEAQAIHKAAAGKVTRSARTWFMMSRWCGEGNGLVALVGDKESWTGFAYAIRWKQWAYYASGATLQRDTAAALQWALIEALHKDDRRHYELGWGALPDDDEKAKNIAFFKKGFGGEEWFVSSFSKEF